MPWRGSLGHRIGPGRPGGDYYYYPRPWNWYYSPWGAWGLGYMWDPCWSVGGCGYGYGYGSPYGYGPGYGYASGGGGGYGADYSPDDGPQGALRIKVKPREARVVVNGHFVGTVDDFDGNFQKLRLDEGAHKVELQHEGFDTLAFDVLIVEGQTVTYKGNLRQR